MALHLHTPHDVMGYLTVSGATLGSLGTLTQTRLELNVTKECPNQTFSTVDYI